MRSPRPRLFSFSRLGLNPFAATFTVVTAGYNCAPYIDDYFTSLVSQTLSFRRHLRVIFVDDGSTDGTREKVKKWQLRHPRHVVYVHQNNAGQASATNRGLDLVKTPWVSLIDADDFVATDFFASALSFIRDNWKRPLRLISCNVVFFKEKTSSFEDTHHLRFRFANGPTVKPISDLGEFVQLSASTMIFDSDTLRVAKTRFDPNVIPNFLDGHFVNKLMLEWGCGDIAFLPNAKYFYRKRFDASSAIDRSWSHKGRYLDVLRNGYLDLLETYSQACSRVPLHIQRTVLYEMFFHIKHATTTPDHAMLLNAEEQNEYVSLCQRIFSFIDNDVITSFALAGCQYQNRLGILFLFKGESAPFRKVYIDAYNGDTRTLYFHYYSTSSDSPELFIDDTSVPYTLLTTLDYTFVHRLLCSRHSACLSLEGLEPSALFSLSYGQTLTVKYRLNGKQQRRRPTVAELHQAVQRITR